ncbi:HD domain-containing protein [Bifidobacterium avesanii]|uniref:HD domain-containing protein n=2 Tax=Bifidobacterium avesanii TaxID=1798157 RepID=A0A7K3TLY4_9BIFI|nr:HD domain-containing protein [Bifidobacterium avesanii]NEG79283.1 HD domain-containing protein [Bifidobacterium avesanii]
MTGAELDAASDAFLTVLEYGQDIMTSPGMQSEKRYLQHGNTTTFEHSVAVAERAVRLANLFSLERRVDMRSLVVSGLLHDYFLYDWHDDEDWHRLHGFIHGRIACMNAKRDFGEDVVNDVVADSLTNHMYPLTNVPPKYLEGWLVSVSDKMCATSETVSPDRFRSDRRIENAESLPHVPSLGELSAAALAMDTVNGIGFIRSSAYRMRLALKSRNA